MRKKRKTNSSQFTLLEVVIALAILSLGMIASLTLCGSSVSRVDKAEKRWRTQHMLAQGAEYFLLTGPKNGSISDDFFPYPDYRISCSVESASGLPQGVSDRVGTWRLVNFQIELRGDDGKAIETLELEKICAEGDL